MKASHEKEVETLKQRLKEERQKNEKVEAELLQAQQTIHRLQESRNALEARAAGPVVAQTLDRFIRGMLYSSSFLQHDNFHITLHAGMLPSEKLSLIVSYKRREQP